MYDICFASCSAAAILAGGALAIYCALDEIRSEAHKERHRKREERFGNGLLMHAGRMMVHGRSRSIEDTLDKIDCEAHSTDLLSAPVDEMTKV